MISYDDLQPGDRVEVIRAFFESQGVLVRCGDRGTIIDRSNAYPWKRIRWDDGRVTPSVPPRALIRALHPLELLAEAAP